MNVAAAQPPAAPREPLSPEATRLVTDLARACRAAARAVGLYPAEHPVVTSTLSRVVEAAERATATGELRLSILPDAIAVRGQRPAHVDPAVAELAALLHAHQVGQLAIAPQSAIGEWRRFLSLLALPPDQTRWRGGLATMWASEGQTRITAQQIDYSGLLRERINGERATWNAIISECLEDNAQADNDWMLDLVLEILEGPEHLDHLLAAVEERVPGDAGQGPLVVAGLLQAVAQFVARTEPDQLESLLGRMARTAATMPIKTLGPIAAARSDAQRPELARFVGALAQRMTEASLADRVAAEFGGGSGMSDALAETLARLVPDVERRSSILALARHTLEHSSDGAAGGHAQTHVEELLTSHDDRPFVSDAYSTELQRAAERAVDLDRDTTDAAHRVVAWTGTVSEDRVRLLDAHLLVDLMQMKREEAAWREMAALTVSRVNVLVVLGDFHAAAFLVEALRLQHEDHPVPEIRAAALQALGETLSPHLMRHVASHLDAADASLVMACTRFCHAIGTSIIPPLAEVLSRETRARARQHLIAILAAFGSAGRQAVERLMQSPNVAVRRTAVLLLREFGGNDALPELKSLLNDEEPHVQRDATRAIVVLGIVAAYDTLMHALSEGSERSREAITSVLWTLPAEDTTALLAHIVTNAPLSGKLWSIHERALLRLATVNSPVAIGALGATLQRGSPFAPFRTAALRRRAANALARIGTGEAIDALQAAALEGPWGARRAAKAALALGPDTGTAASRGR